jgi:hypothetical protein
MKILQVLMCCLILISLTSCSTVPEVTEPPLCAIERPVFIPLTVEQQREIRKVDDGRALGVIATNQALAQSYILSTEALIRSHDTPLGSCD